MQAIKLVHTANMNREEWAQTRNELKGIGGSDIAVILGLNEHKSPVRLYMELRGEVEKKDLSEVMAVKMGHKLEPIVAELFEEDTGFKTQKCNFILGHSKNPYMFANLDRIVTTPEGRGVLEIKTTNAFLGQEWEGPFIPDAYMAQVQFYLSVTGMQFAFIAVLIGGQDYKCFRIERDENFISIIEKEVTKFMQNVEKGIRPNMDGSADAKELLAAMFPAELVKQKTIELPAEDWAVTFEKRMILQKQMKELKKEIDLIDNQFREQIGENEAAEIVENGEFLGAVTWRTKTSTKVDFKRLEEENPEFWAQFQALKEKYSYEEKSRSIGYKPAKRGK